LAGTIPRDITTGALQISKDCERLLLNERSGIGTHSDFAALRASG
jgi:hypothetical protein